MFSSRFKRTECYSTLCLLVSLSSWWKSLRALCTASTSSSPSSLQDGKDTGPPGDVLVSPITFRDARQLTETLIYFIFLHYYFMFCYSKIGHIQCCVSSNYLYGVTIKNIRCIPAFSHQNSTWCGLGWASGLGRCLQNTCTAASMSLSPGIVYPINNTNI